MSSSASGSTNVKPSDDHSLNIKNIDMTDEMKDLVITVTKQAMEKYSIEKDIAAFIKKQFDEVYGMFNLKNNN